MLSTIENPVKSFANCLKQSSSRICQLQAITGAEKQWSPKLGFQGTYLMTYGTVSDPQFRTGFPHIKMATGTFKCPEGGERQCTSIKQISNLLLEIFTDITKNHLLLRENLAGKLWQDQLMSLVVGVISGFEIFTILDIQREIQL
jgi:hypothetical protein